MTIFPSFQVLQQPFNPNLARADYNAVAIQDAADLAGAAPGAAGAAGALRRDHLPAARGKIST